MDQFKLIYKIPLICKSEIYTPSLWFDLLNVHLELVSKSKQVKKFDKKYIFYKKYKRNIYKYDTKIN